MQNRTELQGEYLQLINKLNTANRKKNQSTELSFSIRSNASKSQFLLCTVNCEQYLCLASTTSSQIWVVDANFEFQNLAKYILKHMTIDQENLNLTIINSLRRLFTVESSDQ